MCRVECCMWHVLILLATITNNIHVNYKLMQFRSLQKEIVLLLFYLKF